MATKRTGLGRGIGALIPTTDDAPRATRPVDVFFPDSEAPKAAVEAVENAADANLVTVPGAHLARLNPHDIVPNAQQPRTVFDEEDLAELIHSVKEFGVLQPIVVRPHPDQAGKYELVMGERRLRATKAAGLDSIPAVIKDTANEAMLRDALLENLHRSQLNPLEEASAYQQLLADFGITQEELATRIGRSRPQISNTLRLLKLPEPVQMRVAAGVLSAGHARAIWRPATRRPCSAWPTRSSTRTSRCGLPRPSWLRIRSPGDRSRPLGSVRSSSTIFQAVSATASTPGSRSPSARERARSASISRPFRTFAGSSPNSARTSKDSDADGPLRDPGRSYASRATAARTSSS